MLMVNNSQKGCQKLNCFYFLVFKLMYWRYIYTWLTQRFFLEPVDSWKFQHDLTLCPFEGRAKNIPARDNFALIIFGLWINYLVELFANCLVYSLPNIVSIKNKKYMKVFYLFVSKYPLSYRAKYFTCLIYNCHSGFPVSGLEGLEICNYAAESFFGSTVKHCRCMIPIFPLRFHLN